VRKHPAVSHARIDLNHFHRRNKLLATIAVGATTITNIELQLAK
jgi:hypothetical protein